MASWDLAERVIDASSRSCHEDLQHALEQPSGGGKLSLFCQEEVGSVLRDFASPHAVSLKHYNIYCGECII